jgi:hypothetical protein
MPWQVLVGVCAVLAVTAIYFLWARKLPQAQEQPKQQ